MLIDLQNILALQDSSWVIQREVGRGGSGIVSRCTSPAYPDVVVKKGVLFRLREEARMMHMLNHPNVARAYAVLSTSETTYDDDVTGYLAMRRLGPSLANLLTAPNARYEARVCRRQAVCLMAAALVAHSFACLTLTDALLCGPCLGVNSKQQAADSG